VAYWLWRWVYPVRLGIAATVSTIARRKGRNPLWKKNIPIKLVGGFNPSEKY